MADNHTVHQRSPKPARQPQLARQVVRRTRYHGHRRQAYLPADKDEPDLVDRNNVALGHGEGDGEGRNSPRPVIVGAGAWVGNACAVANEQRELRVLALARLAVTLTLQ
jgi:hypothetical protein